MNINYIYKNSKDNDKFTSDGARIELKEYSNDLVFYTPLNSLRAEYAFLNKSSKYENKPLIYTGGKFGSYIKLNDYLKFDGNNLHSIGDEGRVSFYLGTNKVNGKASVILSNDKFAEDELLQAGDYSFTVTVQDYPSAEIVINIIRGDTFSTLKKKLLFSLDPIVYRFELDNKYTDPNKIALVSTAPGKSIKVTAGNQGFNLLDFVSVESTDYGTYPSKNITLLEFGNFKINHIAKEVDSKIFSYLEIVIEDQSFEIPWNNDAVSLDNIEVDFDKQVIYIFINGELVKIDLLENPRTPSDSDLILRGNKDEYYSFDELIIENRIKNRKSFELAKTQLTKYSTENPYIDFHFSSSEVKDGMELITKEQYGCHACLNDNGRFYYYNASSWRQSDGTYSKSNEFATFQNQIKDFNFSGNDFFVRVFFNSNGTEIAYLDGLQFTLDDGLYEDENGNTPAIIIGDKEWNIDPESSYEEEMKEDMIDRVLVITTDQGSTTIPFTIDDVYGDSSFWQDGYQLRMTLDEIINYINSYYPDGINKVYKDSKGRIVLVSETKGSNAYITVSGDAVPIIFGGEAETTARGENSTAGNIDYTKFYDTVKTYTGDTLLALEATDEQIQLFLKEALEYYKRYKGDELSKYTCQLEGNWQDGYTIPSVIEKQQDIVDILFRPVFPMKFYGETLVDGQEDIVTLTLANYLFGGSSGAHLSGGVAQDWYISLMSIQDFKQALGLNPKWEILNNRIMIYPNYIARFTKVSIIYKSPISLEKALSDPDIIQYVSGKILMLAGNIRGAYGSTLSNGSIPVQMNADALYERGKQMIDAVMERWQSMQPPLGFFLG